MKQHILAGLLAAALSQMANATIVIVNNDSAGEGFNDPTPVLSVGGNPGMTLGDQRLNVFNKAAEILNDTFQIDTIVKVGSSFDPLTCSTYYATLGQAGPAAVEFDYGTHSITPHALHNQLVGYDADTGQVEINAQFNSSIDNNDSCLIGTNWYYGFDAPTGSDNSLLSVVLHEIMHGMGFLSYLQYTGESGAGWNTAYGFEEGFDPYTRKLKDAASGQLLTNQAPSTRYNVMRSGNQLVWNGTEANAQSGGYSAGTNAGQIQMYAPSSYESGSSVSHFDTAMSPNELMEPQYTEFLNTAGLAEQLLVDIGWNYNTSSLPNSPPSLSAIGNRSLQEDGSLNVALGASDSDGDTLTFSLVSSSAALNASVSGTTLSINPVADFNGGGTLTVQVSDGTDTDSETITVTVTPVNDAPVFSATGTQNVNEDSSATVSLSATDVDGDALTYSITSATASLGASVSGSTLTLNPVANFTGSGSITVRVSDGTLNDTDTFTVNVVNQNDAPVLSAIGNQSMNEDTTLNVALSATDIDGDTLSFSVSGSTAQLNASVSGSTLTLAPDTNYTGTGSVTIVVSDGSLTDSETFSVTVAGTNDAPVLSAIGAKSLDEDTTLLVGLSATDSDGDTLSFSVSSSTSSLGASVSGSTLTFAPTSDFYGSGSVTVTVSDGSLTDSETIAVTVNNVNDAPVITPVANRNINWGSDSTVTLSGSDVDGDSLTFSASSADTGVATVSVSGTTLTISPVATTESTVTITITANDGTVGTSSTFDVTLTDPDAFEPVTLSIGGTTVSDGAVFDAGLDALTLTPAGGDGSHTVTVFFDGEDRSELFSGSALAMPDSGAFAGTYRIDVTDGSGNSSVFYIERPLRLSTSISPILDGSETTVLTIEGAPAGTGMTLSSDSAMSFVDVSGNPVTSATAVDSPAVNNATPVFLSADGTGSTQLTVLATGIINSSINVTTVARRTLEITVQDQSGNLIDDATVTFDDDRMAAWGLPESVATTGGIVTVDLPALDISLIADATGYSDSSVVSLAAETSLIITLDGSGSLYSLNGLINSRGFTFSSEAPVIEIIMSDGSVENPSTQSLSNTRISYSWETSLGAAMPTTMRVSHSELAPVDISLNPAFSEEVIDVTLIKETPASSGTASGAGSITWWTLALVAAFWRRRKQVSLTDYS